VSHVPDVKSVELADDHQVLLLASDGVWEFLSNEDVLKILTRFPRHEIQRASEEIATCAWQKWIEIERDVVDDITVICVDLQVIRNLPGSEDNPVSLRRGSKEGRLYRGNSKEARKPSKEGRGSKDGLHMNGDKESNSRAPSKETERRPSKTSLHPDHSPVDVGRTSKTSEARGPSGSPRGPSRSPRGEVPSAPASRTQSKEAWSQNGDRKPSKGR
jgi:hypothetical protein